MLYLLRSRGIEPRAAARRARAVFRRGAGPGRRARSGRSHASSRSGGRITPQVARSHSGHGNGRVGRRGGAAAATTSLSSGGYPLDRAVQPCKQRTRRQPTQQRRRPQHAGWPPWPQQRAPRQRRSSRASPSGPPRPLSCWARASRAGRRRCNRWWRPSPIHDRSTHGVLALARDTGDGADVRAGQQVREGRIRDTGLPTVAIPTMMVL